MAGSDIIKRKIAIEAFVPISSDKIKRREVTMAVVVDAIIPRENLEQINPANMNMIAEMASMAA
ncbi:hypothetical protein BK648_12910 [Pseudomonas poae]|uniref:Uncharacterized protein n=1 Tax=Pseudomonas poae TaxID=200451 RepID=A0A423F3B7_9PSED|nr:hypothetical protein BK648_12910 [Pseudomonas poae]